MEKRLVAFWLVTGLIFMAYYQYQARQRQLALAQPGAAVGVESPPTEPQPSADPPPNSAAPNTPAAAPPTPDAATPPPTETPPPTGTLPPTETPPAASTPPAQVERLVLGSLDPTSPYTMAVYVSNRGASVERIELNGDRYVDLDERSGSLGYLALDYASVACEVRTLAPGSPAALATCATAGVPVGLQRGDVITSVEGERIGPPADLDRVLAKRRSGQTVSVTVRRMQNGDPRELTFSATLSRHPLAVVQSQRGDNAVLGQNGPNSFLLTLARVDQLDAPFGQEEISRLPSLRDGLWQAQQLDERTVEFRRTLTSNDMQAAGLTGAWEIVKRFRLTQKQTGTESEPARNYHLDLELEFQNRASEPHRLAWRLESANGLPTEGWWYIVKTHPRNWGAAGARDIVFREPRQLHQMVTSPSIAKQSSDPSNPFETFAVGTAEVDYTGGDTQYFTVALQNGESKQGGTSPATASPIRFSKAIARLAEPLDEKHKKIANTTSRLDGPLTEVAPGATHQQSFRIFAGPKEREVLDAYGLGDCIVYGWGIFAAVAKPMTRLLHGLYAVVGNFGVAIILLTVLVRGCMFPLSRQQVASAKRMQELQPEMKRITEQFKNDREGLAKAQRELWQKHNINPFGGCLPGLLQLPIFIGLYKCLSVDIALRGAPFVPGWDWCSNLAAPDQLWNWSAVMPEIIAGPNGYLGPYLNVLPLISCGLFLVQQKMFTPPPTDEQQEMQHRMMSFMTLLMGFLFFKVPSGLCLYFISSSLWALAERKLLPKPKDPPPGGNVKVAPPLAPAAPRRDTNSLVEWFKNQQAPPAPAEESREERKKRRTKRR